MHQARIPIEATTDIRRATVAAIGAAVAQPTEPVHTRGVAIGAMRKLTTARGETRGTVMVNQDGTDHNLLVPSLHLLSPLVIFTKLIYE